MSLCIVLDEHISPVVATQVRHASPEVPIESVHTWQGGKFVGKGDPELLAALHTEGCLLITYDTQMLSEWGHLFTGEVPHSGVVFIDTHTIAPHDFGSLVKAVLAFWLQEQDRADHWQNQIAFLRKPTSE
jgi:hypothetical protein